MIKRCVICRKYRAPAATLPIAALPENRVKDAKTFDVSRIDLAGPLDLKDDDAFWERLGTLKGYLQRMLGQNKLNKVDIYLFKTSIKVNLPKLSY